jgi:hypothetical protein
VLLSTASLAWTTWSLVDLLGTGWIGVTVAAGADIVWAAVIAAEARGLHIAAPAWKKRDKSDKRRNPVPAIGWAALLAVAGLLVWHGIRADSLPMAVAGPLLPLGAKVVWLLALADMRDPAALTDDEQHTLAAMERGMAFERARHRIEMERRAMSAELLLSEVSTDFDIEVARQDRSRELHRRRPLELPASPEAPPGAPHETPEAVPETAETHHEAHHETPDEAAGHPTHVLPDETPSLVGLKTNQAVLRIHEADPTASSPQIVERLKRHGITTTDGYVRTALKRAKEKRGEGFYP